MRQIFGLFCLVSVFAFVFSVAVSADELSVQAEDWQSTISGQIEAFRQGNAAEALGFAGAYFQQRYRDPVAFYADIKQSGYGPIIDSRSHSFGSFKRGDDATVLQVVELQGPKNGLYSALYQLAEEDDGWRVQGVLLRKKPGIGI